MGAFCAFAVVFVLLFEVEPHSIAVSALDFTTTLTLQLPEGAMTGQPRL